MNELYCEGLMLVTWGSDPLDPLYPLYPVIDFKDPTEHTTTCALLPYLEIPSEDVFMDVELRTNPQTKTQAPIRRDQWVLIHIFDDYLLCPLSYSVVPPSGLVPDLLLFWSITNCLGDFSMTWVFWTELQYINVQMSRFFRWRFCRRNTPIWHAFRSLNAFWFPIFISCST